MLRQPLLLLPLLAGSIVMLCGALQPKKLLPRPIVEPGAAGNDPATLAILDRAAVALSAERLPWMQAKVWHQAECEDFQFQACGRLLTAPGERSRCDLNVKVGKTVGELRVVCDGQALWHSLRLGGEKAVVGRLELPRARGGNATPQEMEPARLALLQRYSFAGFGPLLGDLRQRAKAARHERLHWKGHEVIVVGLAVADATTDQRASPDFVPARLDLRQCCLFLDAQTLWPHRVEWWGAEKPNQPNRLLMQTEYRGAVLDQPLSAERCAAEFTFRPG